MNVYTRLPQNSSDEVIRAQASVASNFSSLIFSFSLSTFSQYRELMVKNPFPQIDFPSPFPLYFFSIPNIIYPIPNRKGEKTSLPFRPDGGRRRLPPCCAASAAPSGTTPPIAAAAS